MRNMAPSWYTDSGVFARERTELFSRSWQLLGPVSAVARPGDYISEDIAGIKVFVIRGKDWSLRAFRNVCRHRGAQLLEDGVGHCNTIKCPYHNWVYSDKGELLSAPWFDEDGEINAAGWPLHPIVVEEWRGLLFVSLDPQVPLRQQLGSAVGHLADEPFERYLCLHTERMEFEANWKIYTDNFVEGYHIPGIHPEFFAAIEFDNFETVAHDGLVRMTAPPKANLFYRGSWFWMWPNWTLSLFDGGINTSRINPLSHDRTELIYHFYFTAADDALDEERYGTIRRNLAVIREDFAVCGAVHRNYATQSYRPGPLSPKHEQGVAYFQRRYLAAMGEKVS